MRHITFLVVLCITLCGRASAEDVAHGNLTVAQVHEIESALNKLKGEMSADEVAHILEKTALHRRPADMGNGPTFAFQAFFHLRPACGLTMVYDNTTQPKTFLCAYATGDEWKNRKWGLSADEMRTRRIFPKNDP